jgi:hypothetical protein
VSVDAVVPPLYADIAMVWHGNGLVRHKLCGLRITDSCTNSPFGTTTEVMDSHTVVVVGCIRIVGY